MDVEDGFNWKKKRKLIKKILNFIYFLFLMFAGKVNHKKSKTPTKITIQKTTTPNRKSKSTK